MSPIRCFPPSFDRCTFHVVTVHWPNQTNPIQRSKEQRRHGYFVMQQKNGIANARMLWDVRSVGPAKNAVLFKGHAVRLVVAIVSPGRMEEEVPAGVLPAWLMNESTL